MNEVEEILQKFDPISLEEMDRVKLMNRTDTKFVFRYDQLPEILSEIKENYFVLEINGIRSGRYKTLYYDTKDFQMYTQHQNGKLNRNKIRYRTYVDSSLNYFEIKFKSNKDRTIKERIKRKEVEMTIRGKAEKLLKEKTCFDAQDLFPKLWVNYSRVTLVNKLDTERLTIDLNLEYLNDEKHKKLHDIVIAEMKQGKRANTVFAEIMKKHYIYKASYSKYCFGILFLYDNVKKNNFKRKILTLNKIRYVAN
jgi:hypothetical protein